MIQKIPALAQLLKVLQQVPYLASKNLYRVATYFLTLDEHNIEQFCKTLLLVKKTIVPCQICFVWKQKGVDCVFCSAPKRDQHIVCVVESWQELLSIEKTEGYTGVYHILGGLICPLEGIGPDDLTISALAKRVEENKIQEIILAFNQTPEGEATAAFIARTLKVFSVKISCLARGMPVGSSLETMDRLTVYKALSERKPF
ncbi:recombination protein RecR [Candidatus Dependentiae bacterium]|nr:recombination protein RecR [Candidatus Dependentiae bacterium]